MNETIIQYFVIPALPMLVVTGVLVILGAIGTYFVARQIRPMSLFKSLGFSWLVIGLGALVLVPLMVMSALSSGAYDPVRDDSVTAESVPWLWFRLRFFVVFALVVSIPVVAILVWSRRPRIKELKSAGVDVDRG
jgi:hypothetical protein